MNIPPKLDTAQSEVEAFETQLDFVLSMHKTQGRVWDWNSIAALLPPAYPFRFNTNHLQALQFQLIAPPKDKIEALHAVSMGEIKDEQIIQEAFQGYNDWFGSHQETREIAHRVVQGDLGAYGEVIQRLSPFAEIAELGSSVEFNFHSPKIVECQLGVHGSKVIPAEEKKLTKRGKLSVKKMPRARFQEVYQDYVCGCILRVVREMFALLPLDTALVTALADIEDSSTGVVSEQPVMSVVIPRSILETVDFASADPSDCVEGYLHRGDFKATRKTGAFQPIVPLSIHDVPLDETANLSLQETLSEVVRVRGNVHAQIQAWANEGVSP